MQKQADFPTKGLSGKALVVSALILFGLMYAVGMYLIGAPAQVVVGVWNATGGFVSEFLIKLAISLLFVLGPGLVFFYAVCDTTPRELIAWFRKPRNDSFAILLRGIWLSVVVVLVVAKGGSFQEFLFVVLTRGAVGYFFAMLATISLAGFAGVRSGDQFRDWMIMPDNDSYAEIVSWLLVGCVTLAMSV